LTPPRPWRQVRSAAGVLLGALLLWLAARGVAWSDVVAALRVARYDLVLAAVGCVLLATGLRAWCWRRLLAATTVPVSFPSAWRILLVGQFINICVPLRAGDVARVYLMDKAGGVPITGSVTSLVLEKLFDVMSLLAIVLLMALLLELPTVLPSVRRGAIAVAVLVPLGVLVLLWRGTRLVELLERRSRGKADAWAAGLSRQLGTVLDGLTLIRRWQVLLILQLSNLGVWLALAGGNYAVLRALGIAAPAVAAIVLLVVLQLGTSVPSTPGKFGVFQYLAVVALTPFGVAREQALTYGVLLHLTGFGPIIVLGGLWWWLGSAARLRPPP